MNWNNFNEQHQATFHREYVACHEPAERSWLVDNIKSSFPQYRRSRVENAIEEVCSHMTITPRKRKEFLERLQQNLETKTEKEHSIKVNTKAH
jgi:hypothetical protein